MFKIKHTCPISFKEVDHNVIRLAGFFSLILIGLELFNIFEEYSKYLILFLFLDFIARIFNDKFSILKLISVNILHGLLKIKPQLVGAAPKRFAAALGASFSLIIFILLFLENKVLFLTHLTHFFSLMLIIAISLETFFGFCIGCKIYSYLQWFKSNFLKNN